jgi:hypothetical protein
VNALTLQQKMSQIAKHRPIGDLFLYMLNHPIARRQLVTGRLIQFLVKEPTGKLLKLDLAWPQRSVINALMKLVTA